MIILVVHGDMVQYELQINYYIKLFNTYMWYKNINLALNFFPYAFKDNLPTINFPNRKVTEVKIKLN